MGKSLMGVLYYSLGYRSLECVKTHISACNKSSWKSKEIWKVWQILILKYNKKCVTRFRFLHHKTCINIYKRKLLFFIGVDKSGYQVNSFLISQENICCGYSLEAPWLGASNEYPQYMFSSRNKKNIDTFWLKKAPYEELCIFASKHLVGTLELSDSSKYPQDGFVIRIR